MNNLRAYYGLVRCNAVLKGANSCDGLLASGVIRCFGDRVLIAVLALFFNMGGARYL